jgi:NAD(P)-dependent dehydrogenase (short-subunit alcohol dehydrogenase family)
MTTILIAGANRGLGLEFARQYAADGATVHATAREPAKAEALQTLAQKSGGRVIIHALDVADAASVAALKTALGSVPLDIVIANAGIYGPRLQGWDTMDFDGWAQTMAVNTIGPLRLAQALHPGLKAGQGKTFAAITSKMGSNVASGAGAFAYRASKAALNKVISALALDWKADGLITAAIHPGWVQTDMGGANADLTPPDSVAAMRKTIAGLSPAVSGGFFNYDGEPIPF